MPQCAAQVTEFGPTARQMMLYRRATPRVVHPIAGPGPQLLDRLLGEVATRHRAAADGCCTPSPPRWSWRSAVPVSP